MPRIKYEEWAPRPDAIAVVRQANEICADYQAQGYDLTLRQLYYQFVSRGLLANTDRSYDRLGSIINKARLAGLLDWNYIVDRTRNLESVAHWSTPADVMRAAADSYRLDKWAKQPTRVEVWVEKEALAGVVGQAARALDAAYFSCRGYVSQSEQWAAGRRIGAYIAAGQNVIIVHLGDHDPSGIDMTRDIIDRIRAFIIQDFVNANGSSIEKQGDGMYSTRAIWAAMTERCGGRSPFDVRRIALNMDQVREYNPPPNPAKLTDSRVGKYLEEYGDESWELDALDPATLDALISDELSDIRDDEAWEPVEQQERTERELLRGVGRHWPAIVELIHTRDDDSTTRYAWDADEHECNACGRVFDTADELSAHIQSMRELDDPSHPDAVGTDDDEDDDD